MAKILIMFLAVILPRIAMGGVAITNYVEKGGFSSGGNMQTLATRSYALPAPVFSELMHELMSNRINVLLGYLSHEASKDNPRAKGLIVITLYYFAKSDLAAELKNAKATDGRVSLNLPRIFCSAIESGFPKDSVGWFPWFEQVNPHIRGFVKGDDHGRRIWIVDFQNKPVGDVLQSLASQSGMTVHYTPPRSGDPLITFSAVGIPASNAFRNVASLVNMDVVYKGDAVYFTSKE